MSSPNRHTTKNKGTTHQTKQATIAANKNHPGPQKIQFTSPKPPPSPKLPTKPQETRPAQPEVSVPHFLPPPSQKPPQSQRKLPQAPRLQTMAQKRIKTHGGTKAKRYSAGRDVPAKSYGHFVVFSYRPKQSPTCPDADCIRSRLRCTGNRRTSRAALFRHRTPQKRRFHRKPTETTSTRCEENLVRESGSYRTCNACISAVQCRLVVPLPPAGG